MPLQVHLIRHAESIANVRGDIVGGVDAILTEKGCQQAVRLGRWLWSVSQIPRSLAFDEVFTSPYPRAVETANLVCSELGWQGTLRFDERLVEIRRGDWDGRLIKEVITDEVLTEMRQLELDFRAPGGESMREVGERMYSWLQDVRKFEQSSKIVHVVAFTHGHAVRSLLSRLFEIESTAVRHLSVTNTSITTLRPATSKHGWTLDCLNSTPHEPVFSRSEPPLHWRRA
jgi:broad specificity phosphatase PhoE